MEELKKKKTKTKPKVPDLENSAVPNDSEESAGPSSEQGHVDSVISVREAAKDDKHSNVSEDGPPPYSEEPPGEGPATTSAGTGTRPVSAASTSTLTPPQSAESASAGPHPGTSQTPSSSTSAVEGGSSPPPIGRPQSALSTRSVQKSRNVVEPTPDPLGSSVSMKSREAWTDMEGSRPKNGRPLTAKNKTSPMSSMVSLKEADVGTSSTLSLRDTASDSQADPLAHMLPAEMNEAHAYVPYLYARDLIARMIEDMKKMKITHISIVNDIDSNYKCIENETQSQFNIFVTGIQGKYGQKVNTFRQVIEVHRLELRQKQQYWDEALTSLSSRNKGLLEDKKKLLIQNKVEFDRLEAEKMDAIRDYTGRLDDKNRECVDANKKNNQLQDENKIVQDEVESEKNENQRLQEIIDELRKRPATAALVVAAEAKVPSRPVTAQAETKLEAVQVEKADVIPLAAAAMVAPPRQKTVIVQDLSDEERRRWEAERAAWAKERAAIQEEREQMALEYEHIADERKKWSEERIILQGDLNDAHKDCETLRTKVEILRERLGEIAELKAKFNAFKAMYDAVTAVAIINTQEEHDKADSMIKQCESDRVVMEEEKESLDRELSKWQKQFEEENGHPPTEDDHTDSAQELATSLEEADTMILKLNAQSEALRALKRGEIPELPKIDFAAVEVKEPEVKVIEVLIPDPEAQTMLEMTQREMEALRREIIAMKIDLHKFKEDNSKLHGEILDATHEIKKLELMNEELERQLELLRNAPIVAPVDNSDLLARIAELERQLKEKERELQDQALHHKEELDEKDKEHEKVKHEMEKDIKKLLKEIQKLRKKLANRREPIDTEKDEEEKDEMEDKIIDMEYIIKDFQTDTEHLTTTNKGLNEHKYGLERQLAEAESRIVVLSAEGVSAAALLAQINELTDELDALRRKIQELKDNEIRLREEMSEKEKKHAQEKIEMETDIKRLLKEIQKLRKKLQNKPEEKEVDPEADDQVEILEDRVFELEYTTRDIVTEKEHVMNLNKDLRQRVADLERDLMAAEAKASALAAAEASRDAKEGEILKLQGELEELRRLNKALEEQMRDKDREMRDLERDHEKAVWEKDKEVKDAANETKKAQKQAEKLRDKVADLEARLRELEAKVNLVVVTPVTAAEEAKEDPRNAELEEKIRELESKNMELGNNVSDLNSDKDLLKDANEGLENRCDELQRMLRDAEEKIYTLQGNTATEMDLDGARIEIDALRRQIMALEEQLRARQKEIATKEAEVKELTLKDREKEQEHTQELRDWDKQTKETANENKKLAKQVARLKDKLKDKDDADESAEVARLQKEVEALEDRVNRHDQQVADLKGDNADLKTERNHLKGDIKVLEEQMVDIHSELEEARIQAAAVHSMPAAVFTSPANDAEIEELQDKLEQCEGELREEKTCHEITREELNALRREVDALKVEVENHEEQAAARLDGATSQMEEEINNLQKKLSATEAELEERDQDRLNDVPPDTAKEIKALKNKKKAVESEKAAVVRERAAMAAQIKELQAQISASDRTTKNQKFASSDAELRQQQRAHEEASKVQSLQTKIRELEASGAKVRTGAVAGKAAGGRPVDNKAIQAIQDKLRESKRENNDLNARIKQLEKEAKQGGSSGSTDPEAQRQQKKMEKLVKELEKVLDMEKKKNRKLTDSVAGLEDDLAAALKDLKNKDQEIERLKTELSVLGVSARELAELQKKLKSSEKEVKSLNRELKDLAENFNSERVLRKKYYNMVEDMKGKIRVYCRVRPMSKSELNRGNYQVTKSPDEYTIDIESRNGPKEFQFDSVFMPDSSQEKVFEDTNNLVQSAVDGYNVCIFAYGQTGSGKTFTIIGDREQNYPGIAPRAFNRIYDLLQENRSKFSFRVTCYMLELYNDRLLDLFTKAGAHHEDKLEIKKDKKGMVVVQGAEVKHARNAKELYALFEEGSKTRHTASTQMNDESSRSHLVIGIIIESTNRATGSILKGKLSLVDLAGSERAAKTGAGAEQLKEAMSINKSLSALGDVISALSSEQQFIPYRNNKLTMLMQDSLGGNAKTLMFVNISPADYNQDESVVSLTYASRVKLITNDAQKNSDNKEISRLKNVILKMKKGEAVEDDAV